MLIDREKEELDRGKNLQLKLPSLFFLGSRKSIAIKRTTNTVGEESGKIEIWGLRARKMDNKNTTRNENGNVVDRICSDGLPAFFVLQSQLLTSQQALQLLLNLIFHCRMP